MRVQCVYMYLKNAYWYMCSYLHVVVGKFMCRGEYLGVGWCVCLCVWICVWGCSSVWGKVGTLSVYVVGVSVPGGGGGGLLRGLGGA